MNPYSRGSEWRKWDLHVHAPGTCLNDGYGARLDSWQRYCEILESSDVAVFGITDYFSLGCFFECRRHFNDLYPRSRKLLLPNLELRLTDVVNKAGENVHAHLIFRPDLREAKGTSFLHHLKTEVRDPRTKAPLSCADLVTDEHFRSATVSLKHVTDVIDTVFGPNPWTDNVLILVPANNDGLRASSEARKRTIADNIDDTIHALFGSPSNTKHYLDPDRRDDDAEAIPKPVFGGSDAHSFEQLKDWLGKEVGAPNHKHVTWIKADPTFEGLLQTLAEPAGRVHLQARRPDEKEPYKWISRVRFESDGTFPEEITLNQNLVSVIGSRSSGKSSLLAYIAHAVDPQHTEDRQLEVMPRGTPPSRLGPAPGRTWEEVSHIRCAVEWGDTGAHTGRIIYVPQNSLFSISERAREITEKITPTLYRVDPNLETAHLRMLSEITAANDAIRRSVTSWFRHRTALDVAINELRDLGDRESVTQTRDELGKNIATLRERSSLTPAESAEYQALIDRIRQIESTRKLVDDDQRLLLPHLIEESGSFVAKETVHVDIRTNPTVADLPEPLSDEIQTAISESQRLLEKTLRDALVRHYSAGAARLVELDKQVEELRSNNAVLIAKNQADSELESLVRSQQRQDETLDSIAAAEARVAAVNDLIASAIDSIRNSLTQRERALTDLRNAFDESPRTLDSMQFRIEQAVDRDAHEDLLSRINRQQRSNWTDSDGLIDLQTCQTDVGGFLADIESGAQRLRAGHSKEEFAVEVLTCTAETRFSASMEGDRIGGFSASSMTPGKQAMFALTLILNESDGAWPLLIDQPEDDLDSRSIFDVLVRYLVKRKSERQIIMATHDANLVIGADSEQVIVANRHGDDRQNYHGRMFDYMCGSLEDTRPRNRDSVIVFLRGGIREHACDILDGGEPAFEKRRQKYNISRTQ